MLTRDLLRFRLLSGRIQPKFVAADDPALRAFAGEIIQTYRNGAGNSRSALQEALEPLAGTLNDRKLAKGLLKLYDDLCEYSGASERDYAGLRRILFAASSRMLERLEEGVSRAEFRNAVFREAGEGTEILSDHLYPDLPEFELLVKIPDLTAEGLLERYNIALAQSLVLFAEALELTLEEPDGSRMRRFFKYLKFFRLLADVSKCSGWEDAAPKALRLRIDGPASMLDAASKYGLQLASFLPAVFQLSKWKFSCSLNLRGRHLRFSLDDSCGLRRRFGRLGIHVPEEVRMFAKLFAERCPDWEVSSDSPFLKGRRGQTFVFPDITFSRGERKVYLELFHKWHSRQLADRLDFLASKPSIPLALGIERKILDSNPALRNAVEEHPMYGSRIFLFREFPSVEKVRKLLENSEPELL